MIPHRVILSHLLRDRLTLLTRTLRWSRTFLRWNSVSDGTDCLGFLEKWTCDMTRAPRLERVIRMLWDRASLIKWVWLSPSSALCGRNLWWCDAMRRIVKSIRPWVNVDCPAITPTRSNSVDSDVTPWGSTCQRQRQTVDMYGHITWCIYIEDNNTRSQDIFACVELTWICWIRVFRRGGGVRVSACWSRFLMRRLAVKKLRRLYLDRYKDSFRFKRSRRTFLTSNLIWYSISTQY
jgi:hypothetical protein